MGHGSLDRIDIAMASMFMTSEFGNRHQQVVTCLKARTLHTYITYGCSVVQYKLHCITLARAPRAQYKCVARDIESPVGSTSRPGPDSPMISSSSICVRSLGKHPR